MENNHAKEIRAWIENTRNYREGVLLYQKYGHNLMLKRRFMVDRRPETGKLLINELCRIAGLNPDEVTPASPVFHPTETPAATPSVTQIPATPAQKNAISLRQRFPFLQDPECPDIIKILVADLLTHYGRYMEARKKLMEISAPYSDETANLAEELVENYLANREIWEELEYYRDNGEILGKAEKFKHIHETERLGELTDVELLKKLSSARAQYSKIKKKISGGVPSDDDLAKSQIWERKKKIYENEIERRKKK